MKRLRIDVLVLVLGIIVLILALIARQEHTPVPSFYSTYDTRTNGYRALYEVLSQEGKTPIRFERRLEFLPKTAGTLFISSYEADVIAGVSFHPLNAKDLVSLKRFLSRGGRLVVADRVNGGKDDAVIGLPSSHAIPGVASAKPVLAFPLVDGVKRVEAPIAAVFGGKIPKALPILSVDRGFVGIEYSYGRGEVIALTAPKIFSNGWLAKGDNARLAYNILATHGPLFIDERVHGYAQDTTMWQVLPQPARFAIVILCVMLLLWLIGGNIRFAPPYDVELPDERDSGAYLTSFSALIRRAGASALTIRSYVEDAHRRASRQRASSAGVLAILSDLDRLTHVTRPTEAQILRVANLHARLRKELS
ncbi:MAG: DUF4350 domain-containing protein [Vulcanimicrobiaceae bacterium]